MSELTKVSEETISSIIDSSEIETFHRVHGKQCIVVLKLPNGFTVVGQSACVDPLNYDEELGYNIAIKDASKQIWMLEGYSLQNKLFHGGNQNAKK